MLVGKGQVGSFRKALLLLAAVSPDAYGDKGDEGEHGADGLQCSDIHDDHRLFFSKVPSCCR